jgi:hypothetical protein
VTIKISKSVILTETDDGMVLLDQRIGRYWQLNSTGAVVLRTLDQGGTVQQAITELTTERPEASERIESDVRTFLETLRQAGVIRS